LLFCYLLFVVDGAVAVVSVVVTAAAVVVF